MTSLLDAPPAVAPPRVASWPDHVSSAAGEALELAASAGLVADPWEAWVLERSLGLRPDETWAALEVGLVVPRQNGKGVVTEIRELAGLFWFGEQLILHSAHEFKTAQEAFMRIVAIIEGSDDLSRRVLRIRKSDGEEGVELRSGGRLRFLARSTGSGRGFSGDCVVLDEAYALTAKHMAALMPTLSARQNPQLWYTSTPPPHKATLLAGLRERGMAKARRVAYFEYSPPDGFVPTPKDRPPTEADLAMWAAMNPGLGIRISEEFVHSERAAMPDEDFARERLGVWPPEVSGLWQVIGEASWTALADPASESEAPFAFAADATPNQAYGAIALAARRPDGLMHVEVVDHGRGTSWLPARLLELRDRYKPCAVVVDPKRQAGVFIPELEAAGLEVIKPSAREMAQACGGLFAAATDSMSVRHVGQTVLDTAVSRAVKRDLEGAWAWDGRTGVDISPLVSVTLAAWGYATRAHLPPEKPKPKANIF